VGWDWEERKDGYKGREGKDKGGVKGPPFIDPRLVPLDGLKQPRRKLIFLRK